MSTDFKQDPAIAPSAGDTPTPNGRSRRRSKRQLPSRQELLAEYYASPPGARLREEVVAAVRNCSRAKLQRDRIFGGGPPFLRDGGRLSTDKNGNVRMFGGRVFYIKADVAAFLAQSLAVTSTMAYHSMPFPASDTKPTSGATK